MGGLGSGRDWWWNKKTVVEDCLGLDVNRLMKLGLLCSGIHTSGRLTWTNTATGEVASSCGYEVNTLNQHASWIRLYYTLTRSGESEDYT